MGGMGSGTPMPVLFDSTKSTGMRVRLPMPPMLRLYLRQLAPLLNFEIACRNKSEMLWGTHGC